MPELQRLPHLDVLAQYPAVELFVRRAQAAQPGFALTRENARAVAAICAWLDGLPLAIELAAAQARRYTPDVLLTRLRDRLAALTGGPRDRTPRQQTLRGALDWSYDLLDARDRRLLACAGVFAGGFTLDAAVAVERGRDARRSSAASTGCSTKACCTNAAGAIPCSRPFALTRSRNWIRSATPRMCAPGTLGGISNWPSMLRSNCAARTNRPRWRGWMPNTTTCARRWTGRWTRRPARSACGWWRP
jgi:hypothetical protein